MRRKIIFQGNKSATITLPAKWVKKLGLKPGDEVELADKGRLLEVKAEGMQIKAASASVKDDGMLPRIISGFYKQGYDELELKFDDPAVVRKVQDELIEIFIGYEIVSQHENSMTVKAVASSNEAEFKSTLRRLFLVTLEMAESIVHAIESKSKAQLQNAVRMEKINNRLAIFCRRLLSKEILPDANKTILTYLIVEELEKIGDKLQRLGEEVKTSSAELKELPRFLRRYYETFYGFSAEKASELYALRTKLLKESKNAMIKEIYWMHTDMIQNMVALNV